MATGATMAGVGIGAALAPMPVVSVPFVAAVVAVLWAAREKNHHSPAKAATRIRRKTGRRISK
jgi:hypothetical protein